MLSLNAGPNGITLGPDGELWFTELDDNSIGEALFPTASLIATPGSGIYKTDVTFMGSGFAANETVQIYVSGVGSAVLTAGTANSSGSFTASTQSPISPYGHRLFLGVGQNSARLGAASFWVKPVVILKPSSGPIGTSVTVDGYGFGSLEMVRIYWNSLGTLPLATATADVDGSFKGGMAVTF